MRFSKLLLTFAAAGALAAGAGAQESEVQESEVQESEVQGLESLEGTVNALQDEAPAEPEAEVAPAPEEDAPAAEPAVEEAPAAPEPAAEAEETAEAPSGPAPPLTPAELAEVQRVAERGRLLIDIARAGMLATRDMLSRVPDPEGAGISGWIAEPAGNGMTVTFYADSDEGPRAVYRGNLLGGRVVSREVFAQAERPALTPIQARMAAARAATNDLPNRACSDQPFNVLVVPPQAVGEPVDVYQMSAPAQRGRFPLGGHFRSTVGADGNVAETRGFTNACLDLEAPAVAAGERAAPIGVTHLLDPMPTEVHMVVAQLAGRPLLVATGEPQRIWLVTGEGIAEVRAPVAGPGRGGPRTRKGPRRTFAAGLISSWG